MRETIVQRVIVWGNSSVIRKKGETQNGDNKKTKRAKFYEKGLFLTHTSG